MCMKLVHEAACKRQYWSESAAALSGGSLIAALMHVPLPACAIQPACLEWPSSDYLT